MSKLPYADQLASLSDPLNWTDEKNHLMVNAVREVAQFNYDHSASMKALYDRYHFSPVQIQSEEDFLSLPTLGVTAMKYFLLLSKPPQNAVLKLTSSGTKGQKTQIWFDQESLDRVQSMLDVLYLQEGVISQDPTNYLIFSYDPEEAKDLGIAYTEKNQLRFAPVNHVHYALKKREGEWFYDKEYCLKLLRQYAREPYPVRLMGLPSFIYDLIQSLGEERFSFSPQSLMITGGGWKAAEKKAVSREEFRHACHKSFGIPLSRIRDAYGMAEHAAPYFHCAHHRFHIPVFNRVIIRDPISMRSVSSGELGLIELITPFNTMMPNLAILTTDWGSLDPNPCSCGWKSPTFTVVGRAGKSKHQSCALQAEDLLKRGVSHG